VRTLEDLKRACMPGGGWRRRPRAAARPPYSRSSTPATRQSRSWCRAARSSAQAPSPPRRAPSAPAVTPRALTHDEILEVIRAFGEATRRAIEAGFDGIEPHGAHGFLIQTFFSPHFNRRTDEWGGSLENRMRFPLAVVAEVKRVIAAYATRPLLLGYRISPEEPGEGGLRIDDCHVLVDRLIDSGIDYLHASLSSLLEATPIGGTDGKTTVALILDRVGGRIPVIAAGQIRTPDQAVKAMDLGLSLVAVGQGLVMNPDWVELATNELDERIDTALVASKVQKIAIPGKLWKVIEATTGWFTLQTDPSRREA